MLAKLPARMQSTVRSRKKHSTRLSHEDEVGVKCVTMRSTRMLVGGVVVDDEMQGEARGRLLFQMFDELQPFLVGVALGGLTENLAVQITEGGEQGDGAVADVVVSAGPHAVRPERQRRLGPFQRLTLAFFVTA